MMHMAERTHVPERYNVIFYPFSKYLVNSGCLLAKAKCGRAGDQGLHRASAAQAQVGKAAWTMDSTVAPRALQCSSAVETAWTLNSTAAQGPSAVEARRVA